MTTTAQAKSQVRASLTAAGIAFERIAGTRGNIVVTLTDRDDAYQIEALYRVSHVHNVLVFIPRPI